LWVEKTGGTLRRILCGPISLSHFLGQKLLTALVIMGIVSGIALVLSVFVFGTAWSTLPMALFWCCLSGACLFCLMTFVASLAKTQQSSGLLGNLLVFPMMMIGGSFFPFDSMPAGMAAAGKLTPNGLAAAGLDSLLQGDAELASMLTKTCILLFMTAALFGLSILRIRRGFANA
jgi:ABC-type multidrug transport system permease subunit